MWMREEEMAGRKYMGSISYIYVESILYRTLAEVQYIASSLTGYRTRLFVG